MLGRVQKPEKTSQMANPSRQNSGCSRFFALFAFLTGFANDRMAQSRLRMEPLGASECFPTWLWGPSRGTQLDQKCWHGSANLRQGHHRAPMFPRAVHAFKQRTRRHQLVVRTRHHLCPAFGLLRSPQARLIPQEHLFVQPEAMLLGVAQAISRTDFGQGSRLVAFPDKPTDLWVTRTALGPMTDNLDHAHLDLTCLPQMQSVPTTNFDAPPLGVRSLPCALRFPMGALVAALEARSIFATGPTLTWLARGSGAIKAAIAFDAQEATGTDLGHPFEKRGTGVAAVPDDDRAQPLLRQQEDDLAQLAGCYPGGHILGCDTLGIQHPSSLSWLFGQQHDAGDHQARTDGVITVGQIGDRHHRAVGQCFGFLAVQVTGIYSHEHPGACCRQRSKLDHDLPQALCADLAGFQGLVQARPFSRKERGLRPFGKAVGDRFTTECIYGIEQRIASSLETAIDRVTKLVQCVNVHLGNAPFFDVYRGTLPPQAIFCKVDCLSLL